MQTLIALSKGTPSLAPSPAITPEKGDRPVPRPSRIFLTCDGGIFRN
jgi:hypothetical protein